MIKGWSIALGIGLLILGFTGILRSSGDSWIGWLDIVGAVFSFITAASAATTSDPKAGPLGISAGLFVIWLLAVVTATVSTPIIWWNFAFACAYLLVGGVGHEEKQKSLASAPRHDEDQSSRRAS